MSLRAVQKIVGGVWTVVVLQGWTLVSGLAVDIRRGH